jgi:hypothetical protein
VAQYRRRVVLHDDELNIDEGDVRRLITEQFPEWRHERIRRIATDGTVNAIHRVGNGHTARFPLRSSDPIEAAAELRREAIAMDEFADVCPFPSPKHVAMGRPGDGYCCGYGGGTRCGVAGRSTCSRPGRRFGRAFADVESVFARGSGQGLTAGEWNRFSEQLGLRIGAPLTLNSYQLGTESIDGHQYPAVAVGTDS